MKARQTMVMGLALMCTLILAGEVMARGGNGNRGTGARIHASTTSQGQTVRPAGSQRRDGTFLKTGTTASGSTTRPAKGRGLQNGTCLTTTTP